MLPENRKEFIKLCADSSKKTIDEFNSGEQGRMPGYVEILLIMFSTSFVNNLADIIYGKGEK